jgi:alpha-glucosidase
VASFCLRALAGGVEISLGGKPVIRHLPDEPFARAGRGEGRFRMHHGNFQIEDRLDELVALRDCEILESDSSGARLRFSRAGGPALEAHCAIEEDRLVISFSSSDTGANRWRFTLAAEDREHVYGCGEQFSFLDLRGRRFPLWTSEQGVGRNKSTWVTWKADAENGAGGDSWWTFFPQPSFVSSRRLWYHLDTSAYSIFDFTDARQHELSSWALPRRLVIGSAATMRNLLVDQSAYFGRQPELPDWIYDGVILGIQGGTDACLEKLARARAAGVPVCGIWAQDWEGINVTSFGQRLCWNWEWDRERYPGLDEVIRKLEPEGVRVLGYINPYLAVNRSLFAEAAAGGYLAKDGTGADYLVDFGEFKAGIVDFTNPAGFAWYKGVIRRNLIGVGLSGWMADFGEYLPTDAVLASGESAEIAHNAWPVLWARCNREAVAESGRRNDVLFFMRAGGAGSQRYSPMMWAGDQNVDWSEDDGLPSVITAALSLGLSGHGLSHSDMGGYTTLYGMKRTRELLLRWTELAALSPLMRGHEGNRPGDNWQFDSDEETLAALAGMGRFHAALKPYLKAIVAENAATGLPVMRPLFLAYEGDDAAWAIKDQYLLGPDLLAAPVVTEGATSRRLHLPPGAWVHLWTGRCYEAPEPLGRDIVVEAPIGQPPVLHRRDSDWAGLFRAAAAHASQQRSNRHRRP